MAGLEGMWRVESQRQVTQLDGRGLPYVAWEVNYVTRSGARGSVICPADRYTPDHVRNLIDAEVLNVETVATLEG